MKKLLSMIVVLSFCSCKQTAKTKLSSEININYDSLRVVLEQMYDEDQAVRVDENWSEIMKVDQKNQTKLKTIMDKYGWLEASKIGDKASDAIFYIIQHDIDNITEANLSTLKELAKSGEAKATNAAMMEDRYLMSQGKKQLYGTQAHSINLGNDNWDCFIWPIKNPEEVNNKREAIGFELSVEENAARLECRYNPNEQLPE